jgi:hypothetical protein
MDLKIALRSVLLLPFEIIENDIVGYTSEYDLMDSEVAPNINTARA